MEQSGEWLLDLGSGHGALLKTIQEANLRVVPFGIDSRLTRIEHTRQLLPEFASHFKLDDIFGERDVWGERHYKGTAQIRVKLSFKGQPPWFCPSDHLIPFKP